MGSQAVPPWAGRQPGDGFPSTSGSFSSKLWRKAVHVTAPTHEPKERDLATVARSMQATGCVIDPRNVKWMSMWDLVMVSAMIFTAIVTPFEVAFADEGRFIRPMWVCNRVVDFLFIFDMLLIFRLAYQEVRHRALEVRTSLGNACC